MRNSIRKRKYIKRTSDEMLNDYEKLRRFRHDYNNHVNAIIGFIDLGRIKRAKEYLLKISDDIAPRINMLDTRSPSINVVVGSKLQMAKELGINTKVAFDLLEQPKISDIDMCIILSNAFDNAIEACMHCPQDERFIDVKIHCDGGFSVVMVNSVNPKTVKRYRRKFNTSKSDAFNHGIGLSSIKKAVESYGGHHRAGYVGRDKYVLDIFIKY